VQPPVIDKIATETFPLLCLLLRWYLDSMSLHGEFSRSKTLLLFKGLVSFKIFFEIGGNVEEVKAYRLIPLTLPLPGHFTVPLISNKFILSVEIYVLLRTKA
jgi:hypothetical protein